MRDISRLDTRLLLAFDALMDERSVTRAAQRLGLTQQGLSGKLHKMRELFADPLFVREARGVVPTPRAEELAPRIKTALAGLENIFETPGFDPAVSEGTIVVAASDYALSTVVAPLFKKFRQLAPKVRLAVIPLTTETLNEKMRSGRVDFALTIPESAPQSSFTQVIFQERYLCAVRADHPLVHTDMDLDTFCDCEHLIVSPYRGDFTGPTDLALARIGRERRVGLVIPNFEVAGAVLEQTDLMAVLPERMLATKTNKLRILQPPIDIEGFTLLSVWAERVHEDPLHSWFRELCHTSMQARVEDDLSLLSTSTTQPDDQPLV